MLEVFAVRQGIEEYIGFFVNGIDWMYFEWPVTANSMFYIPLGILAIANIVLISMYSFKRHYRWLLIIMLVIEAMVSLYSGWKQVYFYQDCDKADYVIYEALKDLEASGKVVKYYDSIYSNYINLMQYWYGKQSLDMVSSEGGELYMPGGNEVLIMNPEDERIARLQMEFDYIDVSPHFVILYND